jgi:hypothetical protein
MLRATSTGEAQICGGAGVGVGVGVGDAVADGAGVPEVLGLAGVVPLAGLVAGEDGPADRVADAPGAAECAAGRLAAALAREDRDGAAFGDGVLLPDAGSVVAGSVVAGDVVAGDVVAGDVVAGEDIAGVGDVGEAGVAVGPGDAAGGGASRWQAAMTTMVPDGAALPPTPLTSAK